MPQHNPECECYINNAPATIPFDYEPERDVLDVIPGYHRIDGRTVRTAEAITATPLQTYDRVIGVALDLMGRTEQGISPDDVEYCDDCGRPWGEGHDPEVEH